MTRLHRPHAIVVRLLVLKSDVSIITPEAAVGFSIRAETMDVARYSPQGAHYHVNGTDYINTFSDQLLVCPRWTTHVAFYTKVVTPAAVSA